MPQTSPLIMLIGIIGMIAVVGMVGLGLACSMYQKDPIENSKLKPYYEFAKTCKLC